MDDHTYYDQYSSDFEHDYDYFAEGPFSIVTMDNEADVDVINAALNDNEGSIIDNTTDDDMSTSLSDPPSDEYVSGSFDSNDDSIVNNRGNSETSSISIRSAEERGPDTIDIIINATQHTQRDDNTRTMDDQPSNEAITAENIRENNETNSNNHRSIVNGQNGLWEYIERSNSRNDDIRIDVSNGVEINVEIENSETTSIIIRSNDDQLSDKATYIEEPPAKVSKMDISQSDNDGQTCPICFDSWTSAGEHRLVALKCGHLFGNSCIRRWLHPKSNRVCPSCKSKAVIHDIRYIYAKSISFIDNSEKEELKAELEHVKTEKYKIELELKQKTAKEEVYINKIKELEEKLQNPIKKSRVDVRFALEKNIEIMKENGCRVFAHNDTSNILFISQMNANAVFPGYSVRQLHCGNYQLGRSIFLHNREIRGLAYSNHNNLLMSVSLDKKIKLLDLNHESESAAIHTETTLWSCSWDKEQPYRIYVGGLGGIVMQYDIRQTKTCLMRIAPESDVSPVISLASAPGGVIACHLNSVRALKKIGSKFATSSLNIEGPFMNSCYDFTTGQLIVTTRANSQTPYSKHVVCCVDFLKNDSPTCDIVHTFKSSMLCKYMSKSCQFIVEREHLFAAYNEEEKAVNIWNINKQTRMNNLSCTDIISDTCSWTNDNNVFLATLSTNKAKIYKVL